MKRVSGFTLCELMVVLSLFVLCATLVMANLTFITRAQVKADVETLYAACCMIQQKALMTGTSQTLVCDQCHNCYYCDQRCEHLSRYVTFGVLSGVKGPPAHPYKVVSVPITFENDRIVFYPDGLISSGAIYIIDTCAECMYAITSGVAQVSFLRKYRYDGGWIAEE